MMSIRSLADFNGSSPGRCSDWLGTATVTARGLNLRDDTTNEGWGLLPGHHRGPPPGHTRGLSHGHGQGRLRMTQSAGRPPGFDPAKPSAARIYDYLLGGCFP